MLRSAAICTLALAKYQELVMPPGDSCLRCGRDAPIYRFRLEHLRMIGWHLYAPASYVNWCDHALEFIPLPEDEGWCRLVPVIGEAT